MSGLVLAVDFSGRMISKSLIQVMAEQARHRAPHGITYSVVNNVGLAQLDSLGLTNHPRSDNTPLSNTLEGCYIVADVRLDNRRELLSQLNIKDITTEDRQIILCAYKRWGLDAASHLEGDFSFAIWDNTTQNIYAARDRLGIKPLYYSEFDNQICISTEAQQLLQHPTCSRRINPTVLTGWCIGELDHEATIFEGIHELRPAHTLSANTKGHKIRRYWDINPEHKISYKCVDEYAGHLKSLLQNSIQNRISGASRVATEMSGGMDSTTITYLLRDLTNYEQPQQVISLTFPSFDDCDESAFVQIMEQKDSLGVTYVNAENFGAKNYPTMFPPSLENPATKYDPIYKATISILRTNNCKLLLTGNGGDEMMAGNGLIYGHRLWRGDITSLSDLFSLCRLYNLPFTRTFKNLCLAPYLPTHIMQLYRAMRGKPKNSTIQIPNWLNRKKLEEIGFFDRKPPHQPTFNNPVHRNMYATLTLGSIRTIIDRYTLLAAPRGIRVEHPFLDRAIMEFVFAVPPKMWLQGIYNKWLLRKMMAQYLPNSICWRKKKTFFSSFYTHSITKRPYYFESRLKMLGEYGDGLIDGEILANEYKSAREKNIKDASFSILLPLQVENWLSCYKNQLNLV